jgi:hypothetical protein
LITKRDTRRRARAGRASSTRSAAAGTQRQRGRDVADHGTDQVGQRGDLAAGLQPRRALHQSPGREVRELGFHLLAQQTRVTYWLAPGRRIILLTVFRKTRSAEVAEVARALQAQKTCEAEHGPAHDTFDREASLR